MTTIEIFSKERYKDVQEFYSSIGYLKNIREEDRIIGALSQDRIIGAVRIAMEDDVFVLRGMQIGLNFQRQGIGTRMLNVVNSLIEQNICWCIPYEWLESFYNQIGFKKIQEEHAPLFLQKRIIETRQHARVIMMVKNYET